MIKIIDIIIKGILVFIEHFAILSVKFGLYTSEPKQKFVKEKSNIILYPKNTKAFI